MLLAMLQAAIAGLILVGVFRLMSDGSKYMDWSLAAAFVFCPALLIMLISLCLRLLDLPPALVLVAYTLYFIVPFVALKVVAGFTTKSAIKFSLVVPIVVILTEIPFVVLQRSMS